MRYTLAHISDIHLPLELERTEKMARKLHEIKPDLTVVTGDIIDIENDERSYQRFFELFEGLTYVAIPGNHDGTYDTHPYSMLDRVASFVFPGVTVVASDGRRNKRGESWWWQIIRKILRTEQGVGRTEGEYSKEELDKIEFLVEEVEDDKLCVYATHWPVTPIEFGDKYSNIWPLWLGWPIRNEVVSGRRLLNKIVPKCRLILYGHRHEHKEIIYRVDDKLVRLHNGGMVPESKEFKVFGHENGEIVDETWVRYD